MSWLGYTYLSEQAERHLFAYYHRWSMQIVLRKFAMRRRRKDWKMIFVIHLSWWSGRILRSINFVIRNCEHQLLSSSYLCYGMFIDAILIAIKSSQKKKKKTTKRFVLFALDLNKFFFLFYSRRRRLIRKRNWSSSIVAGVKFSLV